MGRRSPKGGRRKAGSRLDDCVELYGMNVLPDTAAGWLAAMIHYARVYECRRHWGSCYMKKGR